MVSNSASDDISPVFNSPINERVLHDLNTLGITGKFWSDGKEDVSESASVHSANDFTVVLSKS